MQRHIKLLLVLLGVIIPLSAVFVFKVPKSEAQGTPDAACIARGVSTYMNSIITGASGLNHIKLLSPVFNLTSPFQMATYNEMVTAGANFNRLDGMAGNTYTLRTSQTDPCAATGAYDFYVNNGWKSAFAGYGKPVFFLEFGDFRLRNPTHCASNTRESVLGITNNNPINLRQQFNAAASDNGPEIAKINFFNTLLTNGDSNYAFNQMSSTELGGVTAAHRSKGGINSGVYAEQTNGAFANQVGNFLSPKLGSMVILAAGPWEINSVVNEVSSAAAQGLTPIVRICTRDNCGFTDPQVYVQFLRDISPRLATDTWFVAGPNEPDTEMWASPNCGPVVPPYSPQPIACGSTTDPEYHEYRPYPASVCDNKLSQLASDCGNDLIVKTTYDNLSVDQCPWNGQNTKTCTYTIGPQSYQVSIDLKDAQLPIAGNTQAVANEVNLGRGTPVTMDKTQMMTEYLSWYLEGIKQSASEKAANPEDAVNFSGPIKKLLPEYVQRSKRKWPYGAAEDKTDPGGRGTGYDQHNEIVGCMDDRGNRIACLSTADKPIPANTYRLDDVRSSIPMENDARWGLLAIINGTTWYQEFTRAYTAWQATPQGKMYWYLPMKTEEDRPGLVWASTAATSPITSRTGATGGANDTLNPQAPVFVPDANAGMDPLYFPHMSEVADLARILMGTYKPYGQKVGSMGGDVIEPRNVDRCTKDGRTNLGDDLYGEVSGAGYNVQVNVNSPTGGTSTLNVQNPPMITGTLTDGNTTPIQVQCTFTVNRSGSCYRNCLYGCPDPVNNPNCTGVFPSSGDPESCANSCATDCRAPGSNTAPVALTPMSVYTETPRADDIWLRLVTLPNSVYSRLMPESSIPRARKGEYFADVPAVTTAHYSATAINSSGSVEVIAGAPDGNRSGSSAEIYIPHLGGVYDYFLQEVQTALLPYGYGPNYQYNPPPAVIPPGTVPLTCPVATDPANPCTIDNLKGYFGGTDAEKTTKATIAAMICYRESRGNPSVLNSACLKSSDGVDNDGNGLTDLADPYLDGATADYSVGLFQINLHPLAGRCPGPTTDPTWESWTGVGGRPFEWCKVNNQSALNSCVSFYSNPLWNIAAMVSISADGTNWAPWRSDLNSCGITY